jgi:hypothetical protein
MLGIYTSGSFKKQLKNLADEMSTKTSSLSRKILQTVIRAAENKAEKENITLSSAINGILCDISDVKSKQK